MATGNEVLRRLVSLNIREEVAVIAKKEETAFADAVRFQLTEGEDREGKSLPRYIDDPFWKGNLAAAKGYERYKQTVSPSKSKPSDVMDFFINGFTHSTIKAKMSELQLEIYTNVPWSKEMQDKTGGKALGVNPESYARLRHFRLIPQLIKVVSWRTGMRIKNK